MIFATEQFFRFHTLSDDKCLSLISFHMDGPALIWFRWIFKTNRLSTWDSFLTDLLKRFGPSEYRDLRGELSKLVQTSTVLDYYNRCEDHSTKVTGADKAFLKTCFESGLRANIRRDVRIHRPTTLL